MSPIIYKPRSFFARVLALLLTASFMADPVLAAAVVRSERLSLNHSLHPDLFSVQAINAELVVSPAVPELSSGIHLKSEINYEASEGLLLAQLHGRAAISLAYDPSGHPGLTAGQMTYGQAHYNVEDSINKIIETLKPGVEAAIRRHLNLNADEPLPHDRIIGDRVLFVGVGGGGVRNPVAFVGDALARAYGQRYHPILKRDKESQPGRAELALNNPEIIKDRIIIWVANGVMGGGTFLESRQQLLAAGAKVVEPFFFGSAPGMTLSDLNWIVGSAATPAPAPFSRVLNSGRIPFTPWIDKAMQFSGDRTSSIHAFRELFERLSSQAKLNLFFNALERFQSRGLPEKDLLIWMAELISQDVNLGHLAGLVHEVAELVTFGVQHQQNSTIENKGTYRVLFHDLAALLMANDNRLPIDLSGGILQVIRDRFKYTTTIVVLKGVIADLVAHEGSDVDEATIQEQVKELDGYGLNEVDLDLMTAYFQGSDSLKSKLLIIRGIIFARVLELAEQGMATTATLLGDADETPAEAIERFSITVEQWHRWALAYGEAYKRDHPGADEINIKGDGRTDKNAFGGTGKTIAQEINEVIFGPLLKNLNTIKMAIQNDQIRPDKVTLRLQRTDPPGHIDFNDRDAEVVFLPIKADPWQFGHIFMMVDAIARHKADVVVFGEDNSDPYRKPGLSSLAIRAAITKYLIKILKPFIRHTTIFIDEADLRDKDGERTIFRLIELNRGLNIRWNYFAGSDHRHWDKTNKKIEKKELIETLKKRARATRMEAGFHQDTYDKFYDTVRKEWYFTQVAKPDGYEGESLRIILNERVGEEFEPGWQEKLEALSGIPILTTFQAMPTSSTRNRVHRHWWTVPWPVVAMAKAIGFWGADNASQVAESVLREIIGSIRRNPKTEALLAEAS